MLRSLEVSGFKSFADRSRFEFSSGLTVIVGPNGSGKSNVVDAIKWVLGEKSMKSLRGKDSSDVIFNGSSTRKAMNSVEVSLTFDNSDEKLNFDASEVVVTRRAFRSGEGSAESEYFLNRQPCKLKDIRDLLLGTGLGTHAYSIIEQGRVDSLLQSSPRDRRFLFEEASGVSRFRVKKQEASNRLERVEQALLRLSDMVGEKEAQLNRVKSQAERAQEFRELSSRLEHMRFQAAALDYSGMKTKISAAESKIISLLGEQEELQGELEEIEARLQDFDRSTGHFDRQIQLFADRMAETRHSIGISEAAAQFQYKRMSELEGEIDSGRLRIAEMGRRLRSLDENRFAAQEDLDQAQLQKASVTENQTAAKADLEDAVGVLERLRSQKETQSAASFDLMRRISAEENALSSLAVQEAAAAQQMEQNRTHIQTIEDEIEESRTRQAEKERHLAELNVLKQRNEDDIREAQSARDAADRLWNEAKAHLMELHRRHSAMLGRISTLEELQERHEGLSPGVRYLLTEARRHADGPFRDISGLVADLIQVEVDAAMLIEVALGECAQYLVVEPNSTLLEALCQNSQGFPGRVGFIWMDDFLPEGQRKFREELAGAGGSASLSASSPALRAAEVHRRAAASRFAHVRITNGLDQMPGVLGRADQFIQCEDLYLPLFKYLLGETWIVEDLNTAMKLSHQIYSRELTLPLFPAVDLLELSGTGRVEKEVSARLPDSTLGNLPQIHFVTVAGERYSSDGILCIGPQHASSNLISRRSELRTLGSQLQILLNEITRADEEVQETHQKLENRQKALAELEDAQDETLQKLFECRKEIEAAGERQNQLRNRVREFQENGQKIQQKLETLRMDHQKKSDEKNALEEQAAEIQRELENLDTEILQADALRSEKNLLVTECKVQLAKCEERVESLRNSLRRLDADMTERRKIIHEQQTQLEQNRKLFTEAERTALASNARLADFYCAQEQTALELFKLRKQKNSSNAERSQISEAAGLLREKIRAREEKIHALQLEKGTLAHESENVVARLCEDYEIAQEDFFQRIDSFMPGEETKQKDLHREISQLRSKIQHLGNVNADSLKELDEAQTVFDEIFAKYQECASAKEKLTRTIERINEDCRKLFMRTFERIGEYFYHIFRDLFGGGHAELQLTECPDPLDAGVEIIAQPPGKQRLNLSLMSGGEKTMTCVALLFALFKNHPSQFCILDEVDAALDEANTVRLTEILNQFRDQTQFIIISHSRKTMSVANTIYGVTMQDSGISKQVSVKFEEVNDNGELESLGIRLFPAESESQTEK